MRAWRQLLSTCREVTVHRELLDNMHFICTYDAIRERKGSRIAFGPYIYILRASSSQTEIRGSGVMFCDAPVASCSGPSQCLPSSAAISEWRFDSSERARRATDVIDRIVPRDTIIVVHIFVKECTVWMLVLCGHPLAPFELQEVECVHAMATAYQRWCGPLIDALWVDVGEGGSMDLGQKTLLLAASADDS